MLSCLVLAAPHPRPRTPTSPLRHSSTSCASALASHLGFVPCSGQTLGLSTWKRLPACSFSVPSKTKSTLSFHAFTKCFSSNSFLLISMHFHGGCAGGCILAPFSNLYPPTFNRCLFTLLRTLLHSRKTQLFSFQAIPHSFAKTPGGGVHPLSLPLYFDASFLPCLLPPPILWAPRITGCWTPVTLLPLCEPLRTRRLSVIFFSLSFLHFSTVDCQLPSPALHYWFFFWRKPHADTG